MTNLQKSIQREIALFSEAILSEGGSVPEVSKAAFCKARKKLRPTAFVELSNTVIQKFNESGQGLQWHGYRLLGVDGSNVELPNSKEIQENFGVFQTRTDGKAICLARTLMLYDCLNHMTLHGSLDTMEASENSMLWEALPDMDISENDILIFDRYYASYLLLFYLSERKIPFCFRMKKGTWKIVDAFHKSGEQSSCVTISLPVKDQESAAGLGITAGSITVRLAQVELEGGETELLLTSLTDEVLFSIADLKELYNHRWPIEEHYKAFKHKVCIENFSGKSYKAILQDFYAKIFIMNLTAVAVRPINEALKKETVKLKYTHKVNFTEAIATMKKAVVSFFVTMKITEALTRLKRRLFSFTEPIRPERKANRKHLIKRKQYMTYKQV